MSTAALGKADEIWGDFLSKKQEIEKRQSRRFSQFLGKAPLDEKDQQQAYQDLQVAEAEDLREVIQTAEVCAAALYDIVQHLKNER